MVSDGSTVRTSLVMISPTVLIGRPRERFVAPSDDDQLESSSQTKRVACSRGERNTAGDVDKGVEELGQLRADAGVDELTALVEAHERLGNEHLRLLQHVGAGELESGAELLLGAGGAPAAGRGAHDRDRLACQRRAERRARGPVDRVLEHARNAAVVLGRGDQERVGFSDRLLETDDGLGIAGCLDVVVVERQRADLVVDELDAFGHQLARRPQERAVVRALPEAAGDPEDSHQTCFVAETPAVISTVVVPQSNEPSTSSTIRSSPALPVPWARTRPWSSTSKGCSLTKSRPRTAKRSSPTGSRDVDSKRISGCLAASRKSGEIRCASRCSLSVRRLSTRITPSNDGRPSPRIRPSKSVKRPLTVLMRSLVSVTWKPIVV